MHIDSHVHMLLTDDFHDCVGGSLGEGSVLAAGIGPVEVPDVLICQVLSRRVVHIGERIRPLVQRIGVSVTDAVLGDSPVGTDVEKHRVCITHHSFG